MAGGANTALLVVTDTTSLTAAESYIQGRLTAAGLTVTTINATASAPADVNAYSIVVVAEVSQTDVATKYRDTTAPLLWMNRNGQSFYDNYLVSTNTATTSTAEKQDDVLTVHQSTGNLAIANYDICSISSGGAKQYYYTGTMLSDAVWRLSSGLHPEAAVAWTLESCDDLRVGTAPNRRAVLSWVGVTLSLPTANTTTIIDGFIAWCLAGVACPQTRGLVMGSMTVN